MESRWTNTKTGADAMMEIAKRSVTEGSAYIDYLKADGTRTVREIVKPSFKRSRLHGALLITCSTEKGPRAFRATRVKAVG